MITKRHLSKKHLSDEQREIVKGLVRFLETKDRVKDPLERNLQVAAIIGERGSGKTTVLRAVLHELSQLSRPGDTLFATQEIDAAMVREDFGISAAAIQALRETVKFLPDEGNDSPDLRPAEPFPDPQREFGGREMRPIRDRLEQDFELCLRSTLEQEESYRQLAQELAMSPTHYGKIVLDASKRKRQLRKSFANLIDSILTAHRIAPPTREFAENPPDRAKYVIFIDDLDLAEPVLIRNWVRNLLTDYVHRDVYWILAFDRSRLVAALSQRVFTGDDEPAADRTTGRAFLSKLVAFERQYELTGWDFQSRVGFETLVKKIGSEKGDQKPLGQLLVDIGHPEVLPLLPANPRALEGLYSWLESRLRDRQWGDLSADALLRVSALLQGEEGFVSLLDRRRPTRFVGSLLWEPEAPLTEARWKSMIRLAQKEEAIWGLPVPDELRDALAGSEPEGFLEVLLDIALQEGTMIPYQVLARMPVIQARLEAVRCRLHLPEREIRAYIMKASGAVTATFPWQRWIEDPSVSQERFWFLDIGPELAWEACYGLRTSLPTNLIHSLLVPPDVVTRLTAYPGESRRAIAELPFLPRRCRALLLLVDALGGPWWQELQEVKRFWSPATYTQCVAGLTLCAFVRHRKVDVSKCPIFFKVMDGEDFELIADLDEGEVRQHYSELMTWLESLLKRHKKGRKPKISSPVDLAHQELLFALAGMLELPMVRDLAKE